MPRKATQPPPSFIQDIPAMLLEERPFDLSKPGYLYEIKYDGYRCLAEFGDGACYLRSKTGGDMTAWFPEIASALAKVKGGPHVADGEMVVLDDIGRSDFDRLHARALRRRLVPGADPVAWCVFDVLVLAGVPVMNRPLIARKELIKPLFGGVPGVLPVAHFDSDGQALFDQAVLGLKLEGLVAKRLDSVYRPGIRTPDWVKVKRKGAVPAQRFDRGSKAPSIQRKTA